MTDRKLDNATTNSWNQANWATDEDWVRAAANLEAETGVDFLVGADLGNNLDVSMLRETETSIAASHNKRKHFSL